MVTRNVGGRRKERAVAGPQNVKAWSKPTLPQARHHFVSSLTIIVGLKAVQATPHLLIVGKSTGPESPSCGSL